MGDVGRFVKFLQWEMAYSMCYNKSNRAISYLRNYNSIAVDKLSFLSFLRLHSGAIGLRLFGAEFSCAF
jgi:hypothetical protein